MVQLRFYSALFRRWSVELKPGSPCRRHSSRMPLHHLMIGTWTPPGAIFTVQFDDEKLELKLIKKTEIPQDEPISWMTFDVLFPPLEHDGRGAN